MDRSSFRGSDASLLRGSHSWGDSPVASQGSFASRGVPQRSAPNTTRYSNGGADLRRGSVSPRGGLRSPTGPRTVAVREPPRDRVSLGSQSRGSGGGGGGGGSVRYPPADGRRPSPRGGPVMDGTSSMRSSSVRGGGRPQHVYVASGGPRSASTASSSFPFRRRGPSPSSPNGRGGGGEGGGYVSPNQREGRGSSRGDRDRLSSNYGANPNTFNGERVGLGGRSSAALRSRSSGGGSASRRSGGPSPSSSSRPHSTSRRGGSRSGGGADRGRDGAVSEGGSEAATESAEAAEARRRRDAVREEGTDVERLAEVALLLLRGESTSADLVLAHMNSPDGFVPMPSAAAARGGGAVSATTDGGRLGPADLPSSAFAPPAPDAPVAPARAAGFFSPPPPLEQAFDLWFLQLASSSDHTAAFGLSALPTEGAGGGEEGGGGGGPGGNEAPPNAAVAVGVGGQGNANTSLMNTSVGSQGAIHPSQQQQQHGSAPSGSGSGGSGGDAALGLGGRGACIAEYVYRIRRLLKFHHHRRWVREQRRLQQQQQQQGDDYEERQSADGSRAGRHHPHPLSSSPSSPPSELAAGGGGGAWRPSSYVDDDTAAFEGQSIAWLADSFRARGALRGNGDAAADLSVVAFEDEEPLAREQRIRRRRLAAQHAYAAEAEIDGAGGGGNAANAMKGGGSGGGQQQQHISSFRAATQPHGPPDAGTFFSLPGVGLGAIVGGTFAADLEEVDTDYNGLGGGPMGLVGVPDKLARRLRAHLTEHGYGEELLRHYVSTVGPEPPRERFGARCRRYLLARKGTLLPVAGQMLSEVFHHYLRLLALTCRLVLCGVDATVDAVGISDIVQMARHPPRCEVMEDALAAEAAEARDRHIKSLRLAEVSSANSVVNLGRATQLPAAIRRRQRRLAAAGGGGAHSQQHQRPAAAVGVAEVFSDEDEAIFGRSSGGAGNTSHVAGIGSDDIAAVDEDAPLPLSSDVPYSDEHAADAYNRIVVTARVLMGIFCPLGEGTTMRPSAPQQARRRAQEGAQDHLEDGGGGGGDNGGIGGGDFAPRGLLDALADVASLAPTERLTCFYRIASLLQTHLNGSPMAMAAGGPNGTSSAGGGGGGGADGLNTSAATTSATADTPLTGKALLFANFLSVAALLAPALEVAAERLLVLDLSRRFGPELVPPLPTLHTSEPLPTLERLRQLCRVDRFYRFHERSLEAEGRLTYQRKAPNAAAAAQLHLSFGFGSGAASTNPFFSYDDEADGGEGGGGGGTSRHTRRALWQIFCRYLYYAEDRQTTAPASNSAADEAFAAAWAPPTPAVAFGSTEYFEKRFAEMSARERSFYDEANFRRLLARQRRRAVLGSGSARRGGGDGGAVFSTLTSTGEQQREERRLAMATIPTTNVSSPYFGEMPSLRGLWQQLLFRYGEEPFSEGDAADLRRRAAERAERLRPERRRLRLFYQYYAPEKTMADVDAALDRFADAIPKMWALLEQKYGALHVAIARHGAGGGVIEGEDEDEDDGGGAGDGNGGRSVGGGGGGGAQSAAAHTAAANRTIATVSGTSLTAADSPQLAHLAALREVLTANGDPNRQLWHVDSLIKMVARHVEAALAGGSRPEEVPPLVSPYAPIVVTQAMLDTHSGAEAAIIRQRHLLRRYFADRGYMRPQQTEEEGADGGGSSSSAGGGGSSPTMSSLPAVAASAGRGSGGQVTEADLERLIQHYRYSPLGFEHMWAELVAHYGPDRPPIDPSRVPSRAEQQLLDRRRHTNDADPSPTAGRSGGGGGGHAGGAVAPTAAAAEWMLQREDIAHAERLEHFFDYYTSGGPHFLDDPQTAANYNQNSSSYANATGPLLGNNTSISNGQATAAAAEANPHRYHRSHPLKSREDRLALQRRFLQGGAGGYAVMWRALEAKYGPQPPAQYVRYNTELRRLKGEAERRQRAAEQQAARRRNGGGGGGGASSSGGSPPLGSFSPSDFSSLLAGGPREGSAGSGSGVGVSPKAFALESPNAAGLHFSPPTTAQQHAEGEGYGGGDGGAAFREGNAPPYSASAAAASAEAVSSLGLGRAKAAAEALMSKASHSDPLRDLRALRSTGLASPEDEQAIVDMFLRWRSPAQRGALDWGVAVSASAGGGAGGASSVGPPALASANSHAVGNVCSTTHGVGFTRFGSSQLERSGAFGGSFAERADEAAVGGAYPPYSQHFSTIGEGIERHAAVPSLLFDADLRTTAARGTLQAPGYDYPSDSSTPKDPDTSRGGLVASPSTLSAPARAAPLHAPSSHGNAEGTVAAGVAPAASAANNAPLRSVPPPSRIVSGSYNFYSTFYLGDGEKGGTAAAGRAPLPSHEETHPSTGGCTLSRSLYGRRGGGGFL